jgi:hypothetical protein
MPPRLSMSPRPTQQPVAAEAPQLPSWVQPRPRGTLPASRVAATAPLHPSSVSDAGTADPRAALRYGPLRPSSVPDAGTAKPGSPSRNRWIAIAVAAAILVASAFPPFQVTNGGSTRNLGYYFLFLPANYNNGVGYIYAESVNIPILVLEYVAILSAGVLAWLVAPWVWPPSRSPQ